MSYIFEVKMKDLASNSFSKLLDLDQDFNKGLGKTNLSLDQMRKKVEDLKVVRNLTTDVKELANANKAIGSLEGKMKGLSSFKGGGSFSQFKDALMNVPGMEGLSSMGATLATPVGAAAAGVGAIVAVGVKGTRMAMEFEKGMAQVNTTAQLGKEDLKKLGEQLRSVGEDYVSATEIPLAFNQIISATNDVQQSLDMFEPSLKASKGGFTDLKTITEALTNTLGAVPGTTPTEALDTMFAAVRVGKAEFGDLAAYLPKVIPAAQRLNMSLGDTAGLFAMFTAKGQSVEQTAMLMENAFTALSKKEIVFGSAKKGGFKGLGIAIFDKTGEMRKIEDIAKDLKKKLAGKSDKERMLAFSSIGLDAQASSAFMQLATQADELHNYLDATRKPAGELNKAFENSQNTSDKLDKAWRRFVEGPTMSIGNTVLPVFADFVDMLNTTYDWFGNLYDESSLFRDILFYTGKSLKVLTFGVFGLFSVFKDSPVGDFFRSIGGWIDTSIDKLGDFTAGMKGVFSVIMDANEAIGDGEFGKAKEILKTLPGAYDNGVQEGRNKQQAEAKAEEEAKKLRKIADGSMMDTPKADKVASANAAARSSFSAGVEGSRENSRPTNINIVVQTLANVTVNSESPMSSIDEFTPVLNEKLLRVVSGASQLS